jgi:hypothetical protein
MSERRKLMDELLYRLERKATVSDFIIAWGKLVESCKHEKTHWIQEIDNDSGEFHNDLVKRCYVCGVNIDELSVEKEFVEKLLADFDKACEEKKLLVTPIKGQG